MLKIGPLKFHIFEPFFWAYYIWYYFPIARTFFRSSTYNWIFFGIFACGCGLCFIEVFVRNYEMHLEYTPLIPVLVYFVVFIVLVALDVATASQHIRISFTFWGTLIVYYLTQWFPRAQKRVIILMLGMFLITTATSLVGVIANPHAARVLTYAANDIEEDLAIRMLNIGGLAFFQGLVICVPILVSFICKNRYRIFSIALLGIIFISLLSASFTIALFMFFVAILLGYLANNSLINRAFVAIILVAFVVFMPWADLLSYLASAIENETISSRLESIATSISTGFVSGNLGSRIKVYLTSFNTFLKHPLGVGPEYTYLTYESGIGYHSQFLDDLARYGIFGLLFYIAFFVGYYKLLRKQWGKIDLQRIALPVVLVYFIFLVLNPGFTSPHEGVLLLFLIPAFPNLFSEIASRSQSPELVS